MNYQQYREWKDTILQNNSPLRLDCMNPTKALDFLMTDSPVTYTVNDVEFVLQLWSHITEVPLCKDELVVGTGIRSILVALFEIFNKQKTNIWLPEDVYPIYWELAVKLNCRSYTTLPDMQLNFLKNTAKKDVILLPAPLSPLGRHLNSLEIERLREWLRASSNHLLVLDTAYNYEIPFSSDLLELMSTQQCIIIHSLSKAWLAPNTLGIAHMPAHLAQLVQQHLIPPDKETFNRALYSLRHYPFLPVRQRKLFEKTWSKLTPILNDVDANWQPPETGYFSIIATDYEMLLNQYNILAIPVSVFGSIKENLSVITCLQHEGINEY